MLAPYLELIQLTERYLLEQMPSKKSKPRPPPKAPLKPLPELKEVVKIIPPPPPPPQVIEAAPPPLKRDLGDILTLIKTHCPKLKLIEKIPQGKKAIHLLLDPQSENEKIVSANLIAALKKEGFELIDSLENASIFIAERSILLNHPSKMDIKRNSSGALKLGKVDVVVIASLAELIAHPEKKRSLWTEILSLLKN